MSWVDPCARCNWILMFLTTFWQWKWLKFSGGLAPTPQATQGHEPRSKKPCASVNNVSPGRKVERALALLLHSCSHHNIATCRSKTLSKTDLSWHNVHFWMNIEGCRHNCWLLTHLVNTQSALPALSARILSTFLGLRYILRHKVFLTWAHDAGGVGGQSPPIVWGLNWDLKHFHFTASTLHQRHEKQAEGEQETANFTHDDFLNKLLNEQGSLNEDGCLRFCRNYRVCRSSH